MNSQSIEEPNLVLDEDGIPVLSDVIDPEPESERELDEEPESEEESATAIRPATPRPVAAVETPPPTAAARPRPDSLEEARLLHELAARVQFELEGSIDDLARLAIDHAVRDASAQFTHQVREGMSARFRELLPGIIEKLVHDRLFERDADHD